MWTCPRSTSKWNDAGTTRRSEGSALEQDVFDGVRWRPGPHVAGWCERPTPDALWIRLLPTAAGRDARALLAEQLLDVVPSRDFPPVIRLTANAEVFD
jgi:hypothetical protein